MSEPGVGEPQPDPIPALTLAIDAMGGDHAPGQMVEAIAAASLERPEAPVYFTLVGDEAQLTRALNRLNHNPERITIAHACDAIGVGEPARAAMAARPDSSIARACALVRQAQAHAVVSAGNPGAAILAAKAHFALLPGVQRAALAAVYPTPRRSGSAQDPFALLLDVGAGLEASPDELVRFALMGSAYARVISQNPRPKVALLSTSREPGVGPPNVTRAHEALRTIAQIDFLGAIEGHDLPLGLADVVVCEGYVGDVSLKLMEGVGQAALDVARHAYEDSFVYRQGLRLLSGGIKRLRRLIDYEEYGGAPLLGFDQVMILAHPRSPQRALRNAIKLCIKSVRLGLSDELSSALAGFGGDPQAEDGL